MAKSSRAPSRRIFVSYRREDTAYPAGWLYDRLAERFGNSQVFKDVDNIRPGDDFAEEINKAVGACDVLLALIGDQWLTVTNAAGRRRLDDPGDFVRLEIQAALARGIRVVPILVEGAKMPAPGDLPAGLAKLAYRQAVELSPTRFNTDLSRLLQVLEIASQPPPKTEPPPKAQAAPETTAAPGRSAAPSGDRHFYRGIPLASWWQRVAAFLIDWIPLAPGIAVWSIGAQKHLAYLIAIGVGTTIPAWAYNRWYRQGTTGRSLGKQAIGLRIIRMSDTMTIDGGEALIRDLAHFLDILIMYTGFLLPLADRLRQTLADKAMKTVVVSRRG